LRHESKTRPILPDLHIDHWTFHQEIHLKNPRVRVGLKRQTGHSGAANRRLVPQKIDRSIKAAFDAIPLWGAYIERDPAAPHTGLKRAVCPTNRIASQDRTIADDFLKTSSIVPEEIDFGESSQFDLKAVLRDPVRLLLSRFLSLFLRNRLVILLLRDDAFVQQELQRAVIIFPRETGLCEQKYGDQRNHPR
jgi:hypothetical protein